MRGRTDRELLEYYTRKAVRVDELEATYEHPNWYKRAFYQARFRAVFNALNPQIGDTILDLGSGPGYYSRFIAQAGAKVVSADLAVTYLSQIHPSVGPRVGADAQRLPFRPRSFTKVLATEVLEHTPRPDKMVEEIARVLKPRGRAVITSPSSGSYMNRLYEVKSRLLRYDFVEHIQEFDRKRFIDLLFPRFRVVKLTYANCLLPYPLDLLTMHLPEPVGFPIYSKLEDALARGRGGPALGWTMIAVVEST